MGYSHSRPHSGIGDMSGDRLQCSDDLTDVMRHSGLHSAPPPEGLKALSICPAKNKGRPKGAALAPRSVSGCIGMDVRDDQTALFLHYGNLIRLFLSALGKKFKMETEAFIPVCITCRAYNFQICSVNLKIREKWNKAVGDKSVNCLATVRLDAV